MEKVRCELCNKEISKSHQLPSLEESSLEEDSLKESSLEESSLEEASLEVPYLEETSNGPVEILYMDNHSLILNIQTEDIYQDLCELRLLKQMQ